MTPESDSLRVTTIGLWITRSLKGSYRELWKLTINLKRLHGSFDSGKTNLDLQGPSPSSEPQASIQSSATHRVSVLRTAGGASPTSMPHFGASGVLLSLEVQQTLKNASDINPASALNISKERHGRAQTGVEPQIVSS